MLVPPTCSSAMLAGLAGNVAANHQDHTEFTDGVREGQDGSHQEAGQRQPPRDRRADQQQDQGYDARQADSQPDRLQITVGQ